MGLSIMKATAHARPERGKRQPLRAYLLGLRRKGAVRELSVSVPDHDVGLEAHSGSAA